MPRVSLQPMVAIPILDELMMILALGWSSHQSTVYGAWNSEIVIGSTTELDTQDHRISVITDRYKVAGNHWTHPHNLTPFQISICGDNGYCKHKKMYARKIKEIRRNDGETVKKYHNQWHGRPKIVISATGGEIRSALDDDSTMENSRQGNHGRGGGQMPQGTRIVRHVGGKR